MSPYVAPPGQYPIDEMLHLAAYLILAAILALAFRRLFWAVAAGLLLILIGTMLELIQAQVPSRLSSEADAIVNIVGIVAGLIAGRWGRLRVWR